jgi:hypothetical protein
VQALCKLEMRGAAPAEAERRSDEAAFERGCARMTVAADAETFDMLVSMQPESRCAVSHARISARMPLSCPMYNGEPGSACGNLSKRVHACIFVNEVCAQPPPPRQHHASEVAAGTPSWSRTARRR